MGTINATLHAAEPNTTWVNATFSWGTSKRAIQPSPAPWSPVFSLLAVCGGFPASRELLILALGERVGGYEVKR